MACKEWSDIDVQGMGFRAAGRESQGRRGPCLESDPDEAQPSSRLTCALLLSRRVKHPMHALAPSLLRQKA